AIGSQTGLATILRDAYPQKNIYIAGIDLPVLDWIGKMQQVPSATYDGALVITVDTANAPRIDNNGDYLKAAQIIKIDHHPDVDPFGDINWVDDRISSCAEMIFSLTEKYDNLNITKESAYSLYSGMVG